MKIHTHEHAFLRVRKVSKEHGVTIKQNIMIGILLGIVFFILLAKAIFETVWGTCLIISGLFWYAVAFFLDVLAFMIRTCKKLIRLFRKPEPKPEKFSTAHAINMYFASVK